MKYFILNPISKARNLFITGADNAQRMIKIYEPSINSLIFENALSFIISLYTHV